MDRRPKIRGLVQCLPISPGVLFRYGESILPIRGNAAAEWAQRMRPALEDPSLCAEQLSALANVDPTSFGRICEALKAADMLYDASEDGPDLVPAVIQARFRPQIARLELKSVRPLRMFAAMRAKRVLLLGARNLAFALAEATLESGLGNIVICVPEHPSTATEIAADMRRRYADDVSGVVIEAISYDACVKASTDPSIDYVVAAGITGWDWRILEEHLAPLLASPGDTAYVACVGDTRIVAGNLDAPGYGGCSACLGTYCAEGSVKYEVLAASEIGDSIGMAARLVIQHLWDVATEFPADNTRHSIFDFDLASCALQRRPRPSALAECSRCQMLPQISIPHPWPFAGISGPQIPFRELCKRAERLYVDRQTGLIAELDEGDLLQYPGYQCAALLNAKFCGRTMSWITECGDDMLTARVNAVRRALELLCEHILRQDPAKETTVISYSADLEFMCSSLASEFSMGAVISALRPEDLRAEAFYRAVAHHAHTLDIWMAVDLEAMRPGGKAEVIFEHLHETGVLRRLDVQRCAFGEEGCRVLRFLYQGEVVSVVAGSTWEPMWESGLRDVWLHVSAVEAMQGREMDTRVRFRAAGPLPEPDALLRQIRATERASKRTLILAPLVDTGKITALPVYFAWVCLVSEYRALGGNGHARRNSVRPLVPETLIQATTAGPSSRPSQFGTRK